MWPANGRARIAASATWPGSTPFDAFLAERGRTLGLSGMAFQDAWTLDTERLRQCHIHVVAPDRRIIPFCAYNLTDSEGRALYRPKPAAGGEEPDEG
jgi:7,8-dihydro-6-hydroxymethylpterin dimethyltransferase